MYTSIAPVNVWDLQPRRSCSQACRAIVGGRDILRRGMKWEIGDGSSIKFFKDPWVGSPLLKLWPNVMPPCSVDEDITVNNFITPTRHRNQERLVETIGTATAHEICKAPLPQSQVRDRMKFLGAELGAYSVNVAYKHIARENGSWDRTGWRWVWRLPCLQRIKRGSGKYSEVVFQQDHFCTQVKWWLLCATNDATQRGVFPSCLIDTNQVSRRVFGFS